MYEKGHRTNWAYVLPSSTCDPQIQHGLEFDMPIVSQVSSRTCFWEEWVESSSYQFCTSGAPFYQRKFGEENFIKGRIFLIFITINSLPKIYHYEKNLLRLGWFWFSFSMSLLKKSRTTTKSVFVKCYSIFDVVFFPKLSLWVA